MGLYTEFNPESSGVRGEVAPISKANELARFRAWAGKAAIIGPISKAYAGYWPDYNNRIEFDSPSTVLCGDFRRSNGTIRQTDETNEYGVRVEDPLIFDEESKAFGELLDEDGKEVDYLWVPESEVDCVRSYSGSIPYVNRLGHRLIYPAQELSISIF